MRRLTIPLATFLLTVVGVVSFVYAQSIFDPIPPPPPGCTPNVVPAGQANPPMEPEPMAPVWCFPLTAGPTTRVTGNNDWVDEFDTFVPMQRFNDGDMGYRIFDKFHSQTQAQSQHFVNFNHWMVDTTGGTSDGTSMRPNRSFTFENGKLVVEADVAQGMNEYGGGGEVWPEITVTTAAAPTGDIVDSLYAYGGFGGNDAIGCRIHPPGDVICSSETSRHDVVGNPADCNAAPPSRIFEISGPGRCGPIHSGGARFNDNATYWRLCPANTMDLHCRDRLRLEFTKTSLTLYVNGHQYFQDAGWDTRHQLSDAMTNGQVYIYLSDWRSVPQDPVYRFHWDRVAVNPHNPDGSLMGPSVAPSFCLGLPNNICPHNHMDQNGVWSTPIAGQPTNTPVPAPTDTPVPTPTNTPVPTATNTPVPAATPTNTPVPDATKIPCRHWVSIDEGPGQWVERPAEECRPKVSSAPCPSSLQSVVDAAPVGSTVSVPACTFRETIVVNKPLVLDGRGQAEIRGSEVWSDWQRVGQFWSQGSVPQLPLDPDPSHCRPGTTRCLHAEQVFIDGVPLRWVASSPTSGQFSLDSSRNVMLADDPTGHTVEVTVRERWALIQSDNVTIQGFTMRHAGNPTQSGAITNASRSGFTLQDSVLSDAHSAVVSVGGGVGTQILRNDISRGGESGINGYNDTNTLIQGNRIHDNATLDYDENWAAAGVKLAFFHDLTIDGNEVWANDGPGLWCDIECSNVVISNNIIRDQVWNPIFFEISEHGQIFGNTLTDVSGWGSIVSSSSGDVDIFSNTIVRSPSIHVRLDDRSDRPASAGTANRVHDNLVIQPTDGRAVTWANMSPAQSGNAEFSNTVQ